MRRAHQASLQALPAPTLARLRAARRGHAAPARRWGWLLAAAPALLGAAFGMHLLLRPALPVAVPASVAGTAAAATVSASAAAQGDGDDSAAGLLEENPDLYLWLGSDTSLAME
ncbi:hypothetical protein [Xanthomonas cerealis]|uniref:Uncharacterized protein n=1 Tax=Xanthomonas cerealis pv. cerealis TaxID=152263 RepID=A0A514EIP2_9XANT|nr:hypothetical protein [Xanthomonas translucens]QDI05906.1 hypothetical protein E4A48_13055 [Xanthomonas translucens pv. cerealis]UKE49084.1 hypothetical protein KHA79_15625 [Xanthomonas translucens pv. cerealis]UKE71398.1 hypothetical protein K8O61_15475 [Xanthomonas translucens pv. pistacia]